ncbi:MAG TPA: DUF2778 domain-containing protein [Xanthobacteraceae bacterium]|jgi:hypothetical protein
MFLTFVFESAGTQAGPADIGAPGSGISVFGTIHPDIFRLREPLGTWRPADRVQLASLAPQVASDAPAERSETLAETSGLACGSASLDQRFGAFDAGLESSENRTASSSDCRASFDERFRSAMPLLASRMASPDRNVERADVPKPIVSIARAPAAPARKIAPLPGDDGHTAIYDITAHTVYLPSGRRLEAHSGLGGLMDNPRHVQLRMRGATPPNVYNLRMREQIFHGVRAIRLNPVDDGRMYGRGGILAHTYMLGPSGQSNGCVAFRNYPEFLDAFRKGEISRLAVVDRLESPPPGKLAAGQLPERVRELMKATDNSRQYAAAGDQHSSRNREALAQ